MPLNCKRDDIKEVTDILKYLGAKTNVTKALRLGKKSDKPRLLKLSVDSVEYKALSCATVQTFERLSHLTGSTKSISLLTRNRSKLPTMYAT